jgi:ketosteroid isomerase-like protein
VAPVAEPSGSPEVLTRAQRAERDPKMAIPKVMKKQEIAWNRGDIQGFMEGYMESPSISFTSGGVLVHGWQTLLERYQKRYGDSRKSMGTLRFEHLQITPLGRNYALCVGQWFLQPYLPGDAMTSPSLKRGPLDGVFSLVWARTPEGWRIIHDHSSARAEK